MEGCWRGLTAWLAVAATGCALAAGGCGGGDDDAVAFSDYAVTTADPERTFAPLVEIHSDDPWRPVSARWFIERSIFGMSGCGGARIAVGRTMPELQDATSDWIYVEGLGRSSVSYYRSYYDENCEFDHDYELQADDLTRPHDPGKRLAGLPEWQGFFLDLVDAARPGPPLEADVPVPVYSERTDEGDSRVRLTYWILYGMNGTPGKPGAREGDWERIDILLHADGDRYDPHTIQVPARPASVTTATTADLRDFPWSSTHYVDGTHPVLRSERSTHEAIVDPTGGSCPDCLEWLTWEDLRPARDQLWYGFGGAWGEVGPTDASTGPLGPHGPWPTIADH